MVGRWLVALAGKNFFPHCAAEQMERAKRKNLEEEKKLRQRHESLEHLPTATKTVEVPNTSKVRVKLLAPGAFLKRWCCVVHLSCKYCSLLFHASISARVRGASPEGMLFISNGRYSAIPTRCCSLLFSAIIGSSAFPSSTSI